MKIPRPHLIDLAFKFGAEVVEKDTGAIYICAANGKLPAIRSIIERRWRIHATVIERSTSEDSSLCPYIFLHPQSLGPVGETIEYEATWKLTIKATCAEHAMELGERQRGLASLRVRSSMHDLEKT